MAPEVTNVLIAGLGGQGVLKASDILADAAFRSGRDVKKAEVHGMSQRGGSVTSDVRFGRNVLSPMVPAGEADYVLVLDETQAAAAGRSLRPGGKLLSAAVVDSASLPTSKALNVAGLGMLSVFLDIPEEIWLAAICGAFPKKLHEANAAAFRLGREAGGRDRSPVIGDR